MAQTIFEGKTLRLSTSGTKFGEITTGGYTTLLESNSVSNTAATKGVYPPVALSGTCEYSVDANFAWNYSTQYPTYDSKSTGFYKFQGSMKVTCSNGDTAGTATATSDNNQLEGYASEITGSATPDQNFSKTGDDPVNQSTYNTFVSSEPINWVVFRDSNGNLVSATGVANMNIVSAPYIEASSQLDGSPLATANSMAHAYSNFTLTSSISFSSNP